MVRTRESAGFLAVLLIPGVLVACAGQTHERVGLDQFAGGVDTSAGAAAPRTVYAPVNPTRPEIETITIRPFETRTEPGVPDGGEPIASASIMAVYDAKVGDINGRPIIASRFLEDLMPRLRAIANEQPDRSAWKAEARKVVERKLTDMIRDEVLYREGRARNPDLTQQGILFFVEKVREHVVRQTGRGSETLAEQELLEREGLSMEQFLASIERQRVIKDVLDIVSEDYAPVSWLDIQNEYQRRYDYFNPDPVAYFRLISPMSEEASQEILARLEGGEAFESVASDADLNRFAPERGGLFSDQGTTITGEIADTMFINDAALNDALAKLEEGAWAGPITRASGRAGFVMMDRIDRSTGSLNDKHVQLSIERYLKQMRSERATNEFIMRLRERANLGTERFNEFVDKLLVVAETRVFDQSPQG